MQPPSAFETWTPGKTWHNTSYAAIDPTQPALSAKGKRIVVTGGGYGIGREIVRAFATAGAASVSILGRKKAPLEQTKADVEKEFAGTKVDSYVADLTKADQLKVAAEAIGKWDILVLNAGYLPTPTPIATADPKEWWLGFEVCTLRLTVSQA